MTAIMPTGVRKPKMKPSVEGTVGKIATAIIAEQRNRDFSTFETLNGEVAIALEKFNEKPFQKREGSRREVFEEEKQFLHELPPIPYEIAEWIYNRSVNLDFHIALEKNRYPCHTILQVKKLILKSQKSSS